MRGRKTPNRERDTDGQHVSRAFSLVWTPEAESTFNQWMETAIRARKSRGKSGKSKASKQEGLFKQVVKCLDLLRANPRHPGLQTHEFTSIEHPYEPGEKFFEAYVQLKTPGAYRLFWCYGPGKGEITIIAITPPHDDLAEPLHEL